VFFFFSVNIECLLFSWEEDKAVQPLS